MEKHNVEIHIKTLQKDSDGKMQQETAYSGVMYIKDGEYIIFYDETDENGEEMSKCRICAKPSYVEIRRTGKYSSKMVFCDGQAFNTAYNTPYGSMDMSVKTIKTVVALDKTGGKINIIYKLEIGGNSFENNVCIRINNPDGKEK